MRRLTHLLLSPPSRFVRLLIGEKRLVCDLSAPEDATAHLPVFVDLDGTTCEGGRDGAIVDHLEGTYSDHPMAPEDPATRAEALRLLDWAMGPFHENVTRKIVYEKAAQRFTRRRRAPHAGYECHPPGPRDFAQHAGDDRQQCRAARLSRVQGMLHRRSGGRRPSFALDYFGEVPWQDFPPAAEWYLRMKSRPSFRSLLSDRVPGQPPTQHYAELDF